MTRPSRLIKFVVRAYNEVELALWASLVAFVIFFCAFILPGMPAGIEKAQRERDREVAEENIAYCTKWGKESGTHEHVLCTIDLQELRANIQKRLAEAPF